MAATVTEGAGGTGLPAAARRLLGDNLARQIFWLHTLTVLALVVVAVVLVMVDARRSLLEDARIQAVAVAEAVAESPTVRVALGAPDPTARLQRYAEQVRRDSRTDFVVVMGTDGTRYTHPDPARIGGQFVGDLGTAPEGEVFTQEYTGTLGRSVRAVVPVFDRGEVVALVSAGITLDRLDRQLRPRIVAIVLGGLVVLAVGAAGAWFISRRLRRQTHGMGAAEITRMYEYYDAVLHAVREGLLLVDDRGRVQLVNREAVRLLDLPDDVAGRPVVALGLPEALTESITAAEQVADEIHLVGDRVLVMNQSLARWAGAPVGWVVTFRDHTELQAVTGELDTVRGLAESLRSQNHEAANRLHTVVSLIELGRPHDAVEFATEELETAQALTDRMLGAVEEPVIGALLLGKSAQAAERGIDLVVTDDTHVGEPAVAARDAITVLGNLIDNAMDAVAEQQGARRIEVGLQQVGARLHICVDDSGPGLEGVDATRAFERGWSTKSASGEDGRGLGLALVGQVVRRHDGSVRVTGSALGGARFEVEL